MTTYNQSSCRWLTNKYLLLSIGIYATLAGIIAFNSIGLAIGLPAVISGFIAFLCTVFVRTYYEQLVILDIPKHACSWTKNVLFSSIYASIMTFVFYFIKAPLGYWSIPIALIIAQVTIKPIRAFLWGAGQGQRLPKLYRQKQSIYMTSLYGFYGLIAAIAVAGVQVLHIPFIPAFATALLTGLIATTFFEFHYLYEQNFQIRTLLLLILLSLALTLAATILIVFLVNMGTSGKVATIASCVSVKSIEQYLLSKLMCRQKTCALCNQC